MSAETRTKIPSVTETASSVDNNLAPIVHYLVQGQYVLLSLVPLGEEDNPISRPVAIRPGGIHGYFESSSTALVDRNTFNKKMIIPPDHYATVREEAARKRLGTLPRGFDERKLKGPGSKSGRREQGRLEAAGQQVIWQSDPDNKVRRHMQAKQQLTRHS